MRGDCRAGSFGSGDMKIEAGKYYRMRGDGKNLGQVVGPMYPVAYGVYAWGCASFFFTETGLYDADSESEYDLISEVYVSDTPPADARSPGALPLNPAAKFKLFRQVGPHEIVQNAPVLETKTLRDEFAMAALTGFVANPNNIAGTEESAQWAYRYADAMIEARKK